jgi:hypothetical protein
MNKMLRSIFFALVLASLLSSLVFSVGGAAPLIQTATGSEAVIRLDMLGESDALLRGPYATQNIRFGLPANWAFEEGASLQLIMTASLITDASQSVAEGQFIGATLSVSFNNDTVATIPILAGSNVTYDVPIPPTALDSPFDDGRHELTLFLDAGNDCTDLTRQTSVVVSSASYFTIPYAEQAPVTDLTMLPRPIFQRDSIFPVDVALVVPDSPTAEEMQAALTVATSFGRMSGGNMGLNLVPMSALTPEMRTDSQLIFVGKPSALSLLQGAELPSPIEGRSFAAPGMQEDDGILQLAISPWNTGRAILLVGGNSDAGVVKAAQALSNENIQTVGDHDLAVVASVLPSPSGSPATTTIPQEMRTFSDLGYNILTMNGAGRSETFVRFSIPPGFVVTGEPFLDLTLNHSGLLDFNRSGLTVFLNGNLIGSVLLSDQTASTTTQRIRIPVSALATSNNELRFEVDLAPLSQCSFLDFSNLWLSILPESVLNLPLAPATADTVTLRDLGSYPYPFTSEPTLSNLAFVLSENDPASWNAAAQISLQLGRQAAGALFSPEVAYDGEIPEEIRNERNLIVVGLPTNMQIFGELNDSMPAPFEEGTNIAVLQGQQVSYRFPAESDLGFLELLASPWNADRVILAVVGTTAEGVRLAATALTDGLLRNQLRGNFVLVNGQSLSVADTRTGLGLAGVSAEGNASAQIPTISEEPEPEVAPTVFDNRNVSWIPMAVGGLLVAILIVIIIAALTRRRAAAH